MKRPSFQFYPSDWLRDTALRSCSVGARGLWIDMICFMHEGNPYGTLKVGNKVILPANLAPMIGATLPEVEGWLDELGSAGVFDVGENGEIVSRRMIRDEILRNKRAEGGKLGGNPALMKSKDNLKDNPKVQKEDKAKPTPSSSSSSSSSSSNNPPNPPRGDGEARSPKPRIPTSPEAKTIAELYGRRPTTAWSDKEVRALKAILPVDPEDLALVARYTKAEMAKGENGRHRRDLATFLSNFPGELDRARNRSPETNGSHQPTGKSFTSKDVWI
jgi:hypothetical protein